MPKLGEIISNISFNYVIQDNNTFLDLLAYFLRADCQCISLSCLYHNGKIGRIVIKTNSNKKKDLEEVYENILKIIEYIKNLLNNFDSELNTIYEDFIDNIMKNKFLQDPDLTKLLEKMRVNKDQIRNNLSSVVPENWQDSDDDLSNLIKLRWEIFLKLIDDCKNVKFSMENIENLFYLDANETGNKNLNTQLIHSELLILDIMCYYYENYLQINNENNYYIGSNFKNCPCCDILINILNDNNDIKIERKGCHLKYYDCWPFPPAMNADNCDLLNNFYEELKLKSFNNNDNDDDGDEDTSDIEFQNDENYEYEALKAKIEYKISENANHVNNTGVIEPTIAWDEIFILRMNYLNGE